MIGVMADCVEQSGKREAVRFAYEIGLMFRPESDSHREPGRVCFCLMLSINSEIIGGRWIERTRLEKLVQLSEIDLSGTREVDANGVSIFPGRLVGETNMQTIWKLRERQICFRA
jgi:hypothetical protein